VVVYRICVGHNLVKNVQLILTSVILRVHRSLEHYVVLASRRMYLTIVVMDIQGPIELICQLRIEFFFSVCSLAVAPVLEHSLLIVATVLLLKIISRNYIVADRPCCIKHF